MITKDILQQTPIQLKIIETKVCYDTHKPTLVRYAWVCAGLELAQDITITRLANQTLDSLTFSTIVRTQTVRRNTQQRTPETMTKDLMSMMTIRNEDRRLEENETRQQANRQTQKDMHQYDIDARVLEALAEIDHPREIDDSAVLDDAGLPIPGTTSMTTIPPDYDEIDEDESTDCKETDDQT